MNNDTHKIEYQTDEDMIAFLGKTGAAIQPSEEAFRALLAKLPMQAVPSPYAPKKSPFPSYWWKAAVMALVVVVLVGGGTVYFNHGTGTTGTATAPGQIVAMTQPSATTGAPSASQSPNQLAMTSPASAAPTISNDDSDAGLAADEDTISQQMSTLDTDNTSADQSLQNSQS